jgi:aminoglycoside phosphotransferase (APT) family kinase protein
MEALLRAWPACPTQNLRLEPCLGQHGQAKVWAIEQSGEVLAYVKKHVSLRSFEREHQCYRTLASASLAHRPHAMAHAQLLVACEVEQLLILSPVAGERIGDGELGRCLSMAAVWLAQLHALPFVDPDPLPLTEALAERVSWMLSKLPTTQATLRQALWDAETALSRVGNLERVLCHRDFAPPNWLLDPSGSSIAVLDFEHAQGDHWCVDLCRLDAIFALQAGAEAQFLMCYRGRLMDEREQQIYRLCRLLDAAQTWLWAQRQGERAFLRRAKLKMQWLGLG